MSSSRMGYREERERLRQSAIDRRKTKPGSTRVTRSGRHNSHLSDSNAVLSSGDKGNRQAAVQDTFLQQVRLKAQQYGHIQLHNTASFFGNKAVSLMQSPSDVIRQAGTYISAGMHRKALELILFWKLDATHAIGRLLAAQALFAIAEFDKCLSLLREDDESKDEHSSAASARGDSAALKYKQVEQNASDYVRAGFCVIRAKIYEKLDNPERAIAWYKNAVSCDLYCSEAFMQLVKTGLLSKDESTKFVQSLVKENSKQSALEPVSHLLAIYRAHTDSNYPLSNLPEDLQKSREIEEIQIARKFESLAFADCADLCRKYLKNDSSSDYRVVKTYLAALFELGEEDELFSFAHDLVAKNPRDGVSWMAVGYYYLAAGSADTSLRYLQKATILNPRLSEAWLAFGHAFAAQGESDQAMAAYRTVSRMYPGAQLPLLYMGMEHARQSSLGLALELFKEAALAYPRDPAPQHELGVAEFRSGDIVKAVAYFRSALSLWEASDTSREVSSSGGMRVEAEESTLFNLGHCYRRLNEFAKAQKCYEDALSLKPRNASTCVALGITLHAMGQYQKALNLYHTAMRYNPGDAVCSELLERALDDADFYDMHTGQTLNF